ncbi:MAG: extradiol dioxygenase [Rhodospirillaceae bacterium]|nr:MAG: extradiol dioxygenase [Rhodospirillaceae bacterium]
MLAALLTGDVSMKRRIGLLVGVFMVASFALAQTTPDHIMPKDPTASGLTGPLHTVTIVTPDLPAVAKMYRDGMGMELSAPIQMSPADQKKLSAAWEIPADLPWSMHMLHRPTVPLATQIRVVVTGKPTPAIRKSWSRQELGPYGMGFPTEDVQAWDKHISALGFKRATPEIERFPLKRGDGSGYDVLEATFDGPEFLRNIAISRRDGMAQVGDLDLKTGRGGPAYGTQVVADIDAMAKFFVEVMDYEVRTDRIWRAYEVPFRFATIYAKGAKNGHLALASYEAKDTIAGTGVQPTMPNRGMAMWSFQSPSIDKIAERAKAAGLRVQSHGRIDAADLGARRTMTLHAPNGFMIEVFEPVK